MYNCIIASNGEEITNSLPCSECVLCIKKNVVGEYAHISCPIHLTDCRQSIRSMSNHQLLICSLDPNKKTKNFKAEVELMASATTSVIQMVASIKEKEKQKSSQRTERLLHNLKSLNAHILQDIYTLIPQDKLLTTNMRQHLDMIEPIIKSQCRLTALTLFDVVKLNMGMKAEFSVFEKLQSGQECLSIKNYNVRDVVMIVLHMFFSDFNEKKVYVDVDNYYERIALDFESFHVAVYHIIENAAKYVKHNSEMHISFPTKENMQFIRFEMLSLYIKEGEEDLIFNEGYSGQVAKESQKAGHGIGMYRARRLIALNRGTLTLEAGGVESTANGLPYAHNNIIIAMPLNMSDKND